MQSIPIADNMAASPFLPGTATSTGQAPAGFFLSLLGESLAGWQSFAQEGGMEPEGEQQDRRPPAEDAPAQPPAQAAAALLSAAMPTQASAPPSAPPAVATGAPAMAQAPTAAPVAQAAAAAAPAIPDEITPAGAPPASLPHPAAPHAADSGPAPASLHAMPGLATGQAQSPDRALPAAGNPLAARPVVNSQPPVAATQPRQPAASALPQATERPSWPVPSFPGVAEAPAADPAAVGTLPSTDISRATTKPGGPQAPLTDIGGVSAPPAPVVAGPSVALPQTSINTPYPSAAGATLAAAYTSPRTAAAPAGAPPAAIPAEGTTPEVATPDGGQAPRTIFAYVERPAAEGTAPSALPPARPQPVVEPALNMRTAAAPATEVGAGAVLAAPTQPGATDQPVGLHSVAAPPSQPVAGEQSASAQPAATPDAQPIAGQQPPAGQAAVAPGTPAAMPEPVAGIPTASPTPAAQPVAVQPEPGPAATQADTAAGLAPAQSQAGATASGPTVHTDASGQAASRGPVTARAQADQPARRHVGAASLRDAAPERYHDHKQWPNVGSFAPRLEQETTPLPQAAEPRETVARPAPETSRPGPAAASRPADTRPAERSAPTHPERAVSAPTARPEATAERPGEHVSATRATEPATAAAEPAVVSSDSESLAAVPLTGNREPAPLAAQAEVPAPATARAVEHIAVIRQLTEAVQHGLRQGASEIVLRLDPPSLGSVRLVVQRQDAVVHTTLQVTQGQAHDLLQRHLGELRTALAASGLEVGDCNIEFGGREQPGSLPQQGHPAPTHTYSLRGRAQAQPATPAGATAVPTRSRPLGLDYLA